MSTHNVEFLIDGLCFRVEADYSPGQPGVHTLPNGDPGYPDDPEEFWINSVKVKVEGIWTEVADVLTAAEADLDDLENPIARETYRLITDPEWSDDPPEPDDPRKHDWWESRLP